MAESDRLLATAKAVFPQLWETPDNEVPMQHKAALTLARQRCMDKLIAGLEVYHSYVDTDEAEMNEIYADNIAAGTTPEPDEKRELANVEFNLPEDAAMVQQVLTIVTYLDNEGGTAYVVRTMGQGLKTSWLGMCMLAQDYLLKLPAWRRGEDGD